MRKGIFVSATDTDIGKTIITLGLALALKKRKIDVGVMKPVQCAGSDTDLLIKNLALKDKRSLINPYFAKESLSPHLAFRRINKKINIAKIINAFNKLSSQHEFMIVEGSGGMLVPLVDSYLVLDLIRDLDLGLVVVARGGLGTINHTLLTLKVARDYGIDVVGVILNSADREKQTVAYKTNPKVLKDLRVPILGRMTFIKDIDTKSGLATLVKLIGKNISISRIIKNSSADMDLISVDKKFIWHPFTQMKDWQKEEPLVIEEARGCYLKDTKGNWYLDGVSSLWVNVHGHRKEEVDEAVKRQLNKVAHSTLLGLANKPSIELSKRLIEIAPNGLTKVFYSDDGSTAVEVALKMAYQYWQLKRKPIKNKFIHLDYSYHGDTVGGVSVGGIDLFHKTYRGLISDTIKVDVPFCYRCPKQKIYPSCKLACLESLKNVLMKKSSSVAAFIIEPLVQAAGGMIVWPKGILKEIRRLCTKYNVLLIADEVATGFGRTGKMFACSHEGVAPDILCLAKGITAGYLPLAATLTTQNIYNAFLGEYKQQKTFFHGHTFTGNPLGCAAAIANLDIFKKEATLKNLIPKIRFLDNKLKRFHNLKHVGNVRQKGFMVGIELVRNKKNKKPYDFSKKIGTKVCKSIRKYGIILRPLGDVVVLMPPLAISKEGLKNLVDITYKVIREVTDK